MHSNNKRNQKGKRLRRLVDTIAQTQPIYERAINENGENRN